MVNSGGTLEITAAVLTSAKPLVLNGPGFLNQGALEDADVAATWPGAITISAGTFINVTASTLTVSGVVSNIAGQTGSLNKLGAGTLALTATDTYTGATTVSAGTLSLTGPPVESPTTTSRLTVGPGATLRLDNRAASPPGSGSTTGPDHLERGQFHLRPQARGQPRPRRSAP